MKKLSLKIQEAVHEYREIETDGVTLYPVRVRDYSLFQTARPAIEALQTSFPLQYLSMPLLQAYFQMDVMEPMVSGTEPTGLYGCALLALALSLRLLEGEAPETRIRQFKPVLDKKDPRRLKALRVLLNGEEQVDITPVRFQRWRGIIAAQNGVELESDNADPELVRAERELRQMSETKLDVNIWQMKSSVAALTGADEREISDWPLKKLTDRADAIQRALEFIVCGVGGAMGGFGKGGNPVPHPFYAKMERESAHVALGDFAGGAGERAVANAGQRVT